MQLALREGSWTSEPEVRTIFSRTGTAGSVPSIPDADQHLRQRDRAQASLGMGPTIMDKGRRLIRRLESIVGNQIGQLAFEFSPTPSNCVQQL